MVHVICINGIKKEIAFIRHEDAQAFPAACCSVKLLCANVFHDMEIRYSRYLRFESLCGSQGARESREPDAGTETVVQAGPPPADSAAPDSVFPNDRVISLERR